MPRSASISIFGGGEGYSETEKSQSAKICLNFNFQGGLFWNWKVTKCQDLPQFPFSGGGGGILKLKSHKVPRSASISIFRGGILKLKSHKVPRSASISIWGAILKLKSHKVPRSASISIFRGVFWNWKVTKCQDLPQFQFLGGGYSETEKSQSAKICLNFHFRGGGGVFWNWKVTKCQDLPKFQFSGGGYSETEKSQSAKICLNFNFRGGGYSETEKSQSAKICLNFNFRGGRGILKLKSHKVPRSASISIFGGGGYSETEKSQSAKICLNFHFRGGGGVFWNWKVTKCQDLPQFQFSGGAILKLKSHKVPRSASISIFRGGYSETEKSQSAKICLNFNFRGGGGYSETEKSQSAKICLNFNFRGGGGILKLKSHKVPRSASISIFGGGGILKLKSHKVPRSA